MLKIFCSDTKQHIYNIGLGVNPSNSAAHKITLVGETYG